MLYELKVITFILVSVAIIWFSWSSLKNFRSHGFFRFFAWETILVLILFNIDYWFYQPFKINQIVSWLLLIISSYLVLHGSLSLYLKGKPDKTRIDSTLMGIEKTTELVSAGAYSYIRHPLYSSLLFLNWGVLLKHPDVLALLLALLATLFLIMTAKREEVENIKYFGDEYKNYIKQTKMFIPLLF